jgi:hypothetical protein
LTSTRLQRRRFLRVAASSNQRVERVVVSRVDAPWIHGRGHSPDQLDLQGRKVVIVGCGAVGSEIAELLAKAGVGELTLIDSDTFLSANASRHLLGLGSLGWNKAQGVATELQRRLPHLKIGASYTKKFERLTAADLGKLAGVDMIVTAGLDIEGEAAVNAWRQSLNRPPAYLSTWVEAYAIVGHAVLLYGKDDLMSRFEGERPAFRLTDWPVGGRRGHRRGRLRQRFSASWRGRSPTDHFHGEQVSPGCATRARARILQARVVRRPRGRGGAGRCDPGRLY